MTDTAATAATAATADAAPAAAAAPALAPGNLVSYTWDDHYSPLPDGSFRRSTRYGIVVAAPAPAEGEAPHVTVAWFEGAGAAMPAELLEPVSG